MATPARRQYLDLKAQHPDAVLLFRMGDFYETFDADAELAARVLGIALASRPMGSDGRVPLAGIPYHQLERYLDRLVSAGHRVAIVEQVSEPGQGLVERRVVRVVTPGTVDGGALLNERGHNWLVALAPAAGGRWGVASCDVTTGELELGL
ncbi:MAG: DNA mismatch repair protein MutS, partial [Chloroflexi bacterium]|nr:DNA mismatch repair protein MutS [Chloroflexota bacterium]